VNRRGTIGFDPSDYSVTYFFLVFRFFLASELGQKFCMSSVRPRQHVFFRFRSERMRGLDSLLTPSVAFTVAITRRAVTLELADGHG
jgi:hypothetical protein